MAPRFQLPGLRFRGIANPSFEYEGTSFIEISSTVPIRSQEEIRRWVEKGICFLELIDNFHHMLRMKVKGYDFLKLVEPLFIEFV